VRTNQSPASCQCFLNCVSVLIRRFSAGSVLRMMFFIIMTHSIEYRPVTVSPEITPLDHNAVRSLDDLLEVFQSDLLLDLCNDARLGL